MYTGMGTGNEQLGPPVTHNTYQTPGVKSTEDPQRAAVRRE